MRVADWLAPDGAVARRLPGFEIRPQQREMAAAVAAAFDAGYHFAVEAGTGIGKTFGYLLPAIEQAGARVDSGYLRVFWQACVGGPETIERNRRSQIERARAEDSSNATPPRRPTPAV